MNETHSCTYQIMPDLTPDEYAALKADIAARGVLVPIEYDESGHILDGYHRVRICNEIGITAWLTRRGEIPHVSARTDTH